jgi:CRISPR-associated endonuclease Csn1
VVGNVYYTKFTSNPLNFIKKEKKEYNLGRMFEREVERNGYTAWKAPVIDKGTNTIAEQGESLATVQRMLAKNTPILTRLSTTQHGAISEGTIHGAEVAKDGGYLPVKSVSDPKRSDVTKYGGFKSIRNAYFFLVEHEVTGKGKEKGKPVRIRTLECLPIYKRKYVESHEDGLYQYCLELGLKNPSIRVKKIRPKSLIKVEGFPLYLSRKTGDQVGVENACNLVLSSRWNKYIHSIEKYNDTKRMPNDISAEDNVQLYDELLEKHNDGFFAKRPNSIGKILADGREKFVGLEIAKQLGILTQILNISIIGTSSSADLRDIGGTSNAGTARINKRLSNYDEVKLINDSITGMYEKEVDLLTV